MNKRQAESVAKKAGKKGREVTIKHQYRHWSDARTRSWYLIVGCPCGCGLTELVHSPEEFEMMGTPFKNKAAYIPTGSPLHPDCHA